MLSILLGLLSLVFKYAFYQSIFGRYGIINSFINKFPGRYVDSRSGETTLLCASVGTVKH